VPLHQEVFASEGAINASSTWKTGEAFNSISLKRWSLWTVKGKTQCTQPCVFLTKISHHNTNGMCSLDAIEPANARIFVIALHGRINAGFNARERNVYDSES
jgi:hypothetical protein